MLEQTEADEWDELSSDIRIRLLAEAMDPVEELSEAQARWIKTECEQAIPEFKAALKSVIRTLLELYEVRMEEIETNEQR